MQIVCIQCDDTDSEQIQNKTVFYSKMLFFTNGIYMFCF